MNEAAPKQAANPNNLELNEGDNFIFGMDVSGSMSTADCPGGMTRIEFTKEKAIAFAKEASKYDTNGIDVLTFGQEVKSYANVTADKAEEIIKKLQANEAATNTADLIRKAYEMHKARNDNEQTVLFVVTDGDPTDKKAVQDVIVKITLEVKDEREFNISFLTVGSISDGLRKFLDGLDDDLKGAKYDIVDVKALEAVDFMTAFAGALND